jgi:hypothetical protein
MKLALYRAIGPGDDSEALVDDFLVSLSANEAVLPLFLDTDIMRFREQHALLARRAPRYGDISNQ